MSAVATLDQTERWMRSVITHPLSVEAGICDPSTRSSIDVSVTNVESIVCRSRNLTATQRLGIYHNAYFARLVECLQGDFPVFCETVGDEVFRQFALEYITARPSRSYTLGRFGDGFADFLRESCPETDGDWSEFLMELARFERAVAEVFDGPGIEAEPGLDVESLRSLAPDDLSRLRLTGAPCLRLMRLHFPVHDWVHDRSGLALTDVLQRRDVRVVLTRNNYRVVWQEVDATEFELLRQLVDGTPLEDALCSTASNVATLVEVLAMELQTMFARWARLRLFTAVA